MCKNQELRDKARNRPWINHKEKMHWPDMSNQGGCDELQGDKKQFFQMKSIFSWSKTLEIKKLEHRVSMQLMNERLQRRGKRWSSGIRHFLRPTTARKSVCIAGTSGSGRAHDAYPLTAPGNRKCFGCSLHSNSVRNALGVFAVAANWNKRTLSYPFATFASRNWADSSR